MAAITVIVPHYACERFLAESVTSILTQKFSDLEVWVINDASPGDQWLEVLARLRADARLKCFRTDARVGPYRIKNRMIALCKSEFVAFQDADDVSSSRRLSWQIHCVRHFGFDVVGSSVWIVDESGGGRGLRLMPPLANPFLRLGKSYACLHPTTLVHRRVFEAIGGFDGQTMIGADSDFFFRAAYRFRIGNVPVPLYKYRRRSDSLTGASATGLGSEQREAYWARVKQREAERRRTLRQQRSCDLLAPPNDIHFDIHEVAV